MKKLLNGNYAFRTVFNEIIAKMAFDLMDDTENQLIKCLQDGEISNEQFETRKTGIAKFLNLA